MYRRLCLFALLTLSSYFVKAWDVAVNTDDKIKFYWNRPDVLIHYRDLSALAYDAVNNTMFLVAREEEHAIVISYNLDTKNYQTLVEDKIYKNIQGIAYDPVESQLFWIDFNKKSIFKRSLTSGNQEHHLLFKMDHELPQAIAVDSCRGYIYWTNTNITRPTIERARFDGSEREVIIKNDVYRAYSIAVDQQTQKLYWADKREGIHYSIESSDLDGKNRKQLLYSTHQTPNAITVSKDSIFWVDSEQKKVWKLAKANTASKLEEYVSFGNEMVFGIVANYDIRDQTAGVSQCENLAHLAQSKANKSSILKLPNQTRNVVDSLCVCPKKECEISVCQHYCVQGDCSINSEGQPQCSCENGFTGSRCEINICNNYCLNDGKCSVDDANKPSCSCVNGHEGERCEVQTFIATAMTTNQNEHCNCSNEESCKTSSELVDKDNVGCGGEWDPIRDPIVITLGCICGLLTLACAVLFTKILDLKRRPRIKKRIIVNKNVTPLTARPDQCEITIENCCNMNICETPCFEPKTTIKPKLLDSKPGKEEKKNLIDNMEHPDDLY